MPANATDQAMTVTLLTHSRDKPAPTGVGGESISYGVS